MRQYGIPKDPTYFYDDLIAAAGGDGKASPVTNSPYDASSGDSFASTFEGFDFGGEGRTKYCKVSMTDADGKEVVRMIKVPYACDCTIFTNKMGEAMKALTEMERKLWAKNAPTEKDILGDTTPTLTGSASQNVDASGNPIPDGSGGIVTGTDAKGNPVYASSGTTPNECMARLMATKASLIAKLSGLYANGQNSANLDAIIQNFINTLLKKLCDMAAEKEQEMISKWSNTMWGSVAKISGSVLYSVAGEPNAVVTGP